MKRLFISLLLVLYSICTYSQDAEPFERKSKILVETGYSILGFGFSSGSGASIVNSADFNYITAIAFSAGYFFTENTAFKVNISVLSNEESLFNLSGGIKHYIVGKFPLSIEGGLVSFANNKDYLASFQLGYAKNLANNITLEPNFGLIIGPGPNLIIPGVRFAMFL